MALEPGGPPGDRAPWPGRMGYIIFCGDLEGTATSEAQCELATKPLDGDSCEDQNCPAPWAVQASEPVCLGGGLHPIPQLPAVAAVPCWCVCVQSGLKGGGRG